MRNFTWAIILAANFLTSLHLAACLKRLKTKQDIVRTNVDLKLKKLIVTNSGHDCQRFCSSDSDQSDGQTVEKFDKKTGKCFCLGNNSTTLEDFSDAPKMTNVVYSYQGYKVLNRFRFFSQTNKIKYFLEELSVVSKPSNMICFVFLLVAYRQIGLTGSKNSANLIRS